MRCTCCPKGCQQQDGQADVDEDQQGKNRSLIEAGVRKLRADGFAEDGQPIEQFRRCNRRVLGNLSQTIQ